MMQLKRISDPQISPDGKTVAFVVQTVDLEANKKPKNIYTVPIGGGAATLLSSAGDSNDRPRWAKDGKIYFISDRASDRPGRSGVWMPTGRTSNRLLFSPPARVAFCLLPTARRWCSRATCSPPARPTMPATRKCLTTRRSTRSKRASSTGLLYRHWNQLAGRHPQSSAGRSRGWWHRRRPHSRQSRRAAFLAGRSGRLRHLTRRQGSLLHDEYRRSRGHQYQQ